MSDKIQDAYNNIVEAYGTGTTSGARGKISTLTKGSPTFDKPATTDDEEEIEGVKEGEGSGSDVEGEFLSKKTKEFDGDDEDEEDLKNEETNTQARDKITPKDILNGLKNRGLKDGGSVKMSGKNLFVGNIVSGVDLIIKADKTWVVES